MWSYRKMKSEAFIHNDDIKSLHVVVQGTQKMVVMGCINFEDHVLIKKQWAGDKMNVMNEKFKNGKKQCNHHKWFSFLAKVVSIFKVLEIAKA
jgi:hypothetical protein